MQSHLNDELGSVDNYKEAIEKFAAQGYEIQITELDITNNGKIDSNTTAEEKQAIYEAGAKAYAQIMNAILEEKAKGANHHCSSYLGIDRQYVLEIRPFSIALWY